jgi:single-stranded-DNA-specific exonuclease
MRKYSLREPAPEAIHQELGHLPYLARHLLYHRGISDKKSADAFLEPDYDQGAHDPLLMKDMDRAVSRIVRAIELGERAVIYSDYDSDGIPGGVVLHDFFKKIGFQKFSNYIPDRHEEGFGLNLQAVEQFAGDGAKLLITIDCGIADVKEVARAAELGIDVIITDHHLPGAELPRAYAILNPKQKDCLYPEKMLCGSGVVFKLVQALVGRIRSRLEIGDWKLEIPKATFPIGWEKWLLDMVGLATLSDMVPLVGENRIFAHYGLKVLRKSPRVGLGQLLRRVKINQAELTEDDIGFMISPRINAASRMGLPMDAFKLLATLDEAEAGALSDHLNRINDERKGVVASIVKEVRKIVDDRYQDRQRQVIVAGNPKWRPALLGLVANTLVEDFSVPVFLWGREGGKLIKGSCRSPEGVDLVDLMSGARDSFLDYGGHSASGGFSTTLEKIHGLEPAIEEAYEKIRQRRNIPEIFVDWKLSVDDVDWPIYQIVERLGPFGVGNPKPLFLIEKALVSEIKTFGKQNNHLEIKLKKLNGGSVSAIGFFMAPADLGREVIAGGEINLVATLEKSVFRNYPELRLRIVDVI